MHGDDILSQIVRHKRREIDELRARAESESWRARAEELPPPSDFLGALRGYPEIRVIAEVKKASPSSGVIRADFDPVAIARQYAQAGAACLSVLTDERFFQGSIDDLRRVHQAVELPILRKDFVLDPVQVWEARLAGASAVLLIAECLSANQLGELIGQVESLHMTPLVEFHDPSHLPKVLVSGARFIGINNRNLRTFQTDLSHTLKYMVEVPTDRTVVSESGIRTREDVLRLHRAGVHAILVGESLLRSDDCGRKLAELAKG